jgi:general secretion pathway protein G
VLKHLKNNEEWNEKGLGAKGFTLIELLVVIVILGILAAVVVFAVSGITDRGKKSACKTDVRTLRTAVEAYNAQEDGYPLAADKQQELIDTGFLSDKSTQHDITISGTSVTITGTDCDTLPEGASAYPIRDARLHQADRHPRRRPRPVA